MYDDNETLFPVTLHNFHSYPVREVIFVDPDTRKSTIKVFRAFERGVFRINKLTYDRLVGCPRLRMLPADDDMDNTE